MGMGGGGRGGRGGPARGGRGGGRGNFQGGNMGGNFNQGGGGNFGGNFGGRGGGQGGNFGGPGRGGHSNGNFGGDDFGDFGGQKFGGNNFGDDNFQGGKGGFGQEDVQTTQVTIPKDWLVLLSVVVEKGSGISDRAAKLKSKSRTQLQTRSIASSHSLARRKPSIMDNSLCNRVCDNIT